MGIIVACALTSLDDLGQNFGGTRGLSSDEPANEQVEGEEQSTPRLGSIQLVVVFSTSWCYRSRVLGNKDGWRR